MWIRFGRLGFSQIIYQVLITLIHLDILAQVPWSKIARFFLFLLTWRDHVYGLSGRVPCYACGGTPPCGLDRHGGSPRPRETWGGASGMGIGGRDFAPVEYPWHGWRLDHSGVAGFVLSPMSGCLGPSRLSWLIAWAVATAMCCEGRMVSSGAGGGSFAFSRPEALGEATPGAGRGLSCGDLRALEGLARKAQDLGGALVLGRRHRSREPPWLESRPLLEAAAGSGGGQRGLHPSYVQAMRGADLGYLWHLRSRVLQGLRPVPGTRAGDGSMRQR